MLGSRWRQARPIYAAAGATVTVVDLSPVMLELDQQVARQRGMTLRTIETSMDDLSMLGDATFDIVIHPVSTCYVPDVAPVYREVARVLKDGGLYISQHKQPASLQTSLDLQAGKYQVLHSAYRAEALPPSSQANLIREAGTIEYVHRLEVLLGGMCQAGLVIEDLTEPLHADAMAQPGSFGHRSHFVPPYIRVKARRTDRKSAHASPLVLSY